MIIRYQPLTDGNGLSVRSGTISAHADGKVVASARAPRGMSVEQALDGYRVLRLLPGVGFSHTAPHTTDYTIDVYDALATTDELSGLMHVDGEAFPWEAMLVADDVFGDRTAYGPWLGREMSARAVRGWAYRIPGALVYGDPVLATRLRLAVQGVVCSLLAGRDAQLPATFQLTNVFGAANPPAPPVVAPDIATLAASRRDDSPPSLIRRLDVAPRDGAA